MNERFISRREEAILGPKCAEYVNLYIMVQFTITNEDTIGILTINRMEKIRAALEAWRKYLPGVKK